MSVKDILVANLLNIIALVLIVVIYFLFPKPIALVLGVIWVVYVIYSNYKLILQPDDESMSSLEDLNRKRHGALSELVTMIDFQTSQLKSFEEFFDNLEEGNNLRNIYEQVVKQVNVNIEFICKYISSVNYKCDTLIGKHYYPKKVALIVEENDKLVNKICEVVESSIDIDKSVENVDLSMLDDIINSLRSMSNE